MKPHRLMLCLIVGVGLAAFVGAPASAADVPGGRYGEVHVSEPADAMRGLIILFSDLSGWSDADRQAAELLARHDMLVVGVDSANYAGALAGVTEACHHLDHDAEAIAHQLQRERHSSAYFMPIMAGIGEGGALAEQVLAASPSNTISGAISIDPATSLDGRFHPCPPDPTIMHDPGLPGFWSVGATIDVPAAIQATVSALQKLNTKVDIRNFSTGTAEAEMMLALTEPHLEPGIPTEGDVSDLPLIELPAEHPGSMLAIVISGDGGWRDLDKTIAHALCDEGVSVIGVDSLRYFWSAKSPEQTASDLNRIIQTYSARWHDQKRRTHWLFFWRRRSAIRLQPAAEGDSRQDLGNVAVGLRGRSGFRDPGDGLARDAAEREGVGGVSGDRQGTAWPGAVLLR